MSGTVDFNVVITNPCLAANGMTINAIAFTVASPSVVDGSATYTEWNAPNTSVDNIQSTDEICGPTSYYVYTDNINDIAPSAWAIITEPVAGTWRLTLDTTLDLDIIANEATVTKNLWIKTTLDLWSQSEYEQITIIINSGACECQYLLWNDPAPYVRIVNVGTPQTIGLPTPTPDSATNQAIYPTFQKCYFNGGNCGENGQFVQLNEFELDGVPLAGGEWISYSAVGYNEDYWANSQAVTATPTYAEIGPHTLSAKWTTVNGADSTYVAITFTILCTVSSFDRPTVSN